MEVYNYDIQSLNYEILSHSYEINRHLEILRHNEIQKDETMRYYAIIMR